MSKIQLDDIYHQHEQQIENDLIQMMNGYFASLKRSPSNQAEMTLFFKSLRMRMSNICKSVGAKCNADMVQQEGQADHKIPLDAAGHTSWAKSKDESVAETSSTTTDVQTAPKNTSLSKDIDQFLQRTRIATKRSSSESIDDVRKQRSRHSYESDIQNIEHRAFQKKQLSFEMAKQLRFQLYAILQAEIRPSSNAICTSCFFCERTMEASFDAWKTHLLNHTGEKEFFCGGCNTALSSKVLPEHCEGHTIRSTFNNEHLQAFICNICEYIKINRNRVIEHIVHDHSKPVSVAEHYVDKVTLIPNLRPRTEPIQSFKYKCVDVRNRFVCGVIGCKWIDGCTPDELKLHLKNKHIRGRTFLCPHCNEIIKTSILYHLNLHSSHLCQCGVCDEKIVGEFNLLDHMLDEHRDKNWDFRRDIRHSKKSPILQKILALFECMVCTAYFHTYSDAVEHYLFIHKSHHADFKMIPLLKQMNRANEIKWLTSMKWDKLLQKHFMCLLCNNIQLTKCHLIRHHVKEHQSKELSITFIDRFTQYPHEAKLRNHKENLSFDQYLIYYCGHCVDLPFANVHDVYNHWRANHERADDVKPFRFVPAELAKCRYCDVIGTFQGLKDHQAKQHSAMHFVIENLLDRSKCGLCLADCSDSFSKHFENHHKSVLETNLFSPIVLSDYTVKKLRNIEEHKKRKCGHCTEIFETNDEFYKHHDTVHHPHNDISETFHDNESSHLICGCCNERLNRNVKLFDHFIEREIDSVEKSYWKTKVVFGNGLTLNKHNLLGTKLDDSYLINE